MPHKSLGPGLALAAAIVALVVAPGSSSAPGAGESPYDVALAYLAKSAPDFGVTEADVGNMRVTSTYRSEHNRVTHVNLNQRHGDLDVFGAHATVNVAEDGSVVFAGGRLVALDGASGTAALQPADAVRAAADGLDLAEPTNLEVISESADPSRETVLTGGGISDEPITARLGWQPAAGGLRLAWQVVIDDSAGISLWNATVDAESGALLDAEDWTVKDNVDDLAGTLTRSYSRMPVTFFRTALSALVTPNAVIDGSSYRVFELPKESPNDGAQTLVGNPADASVSPFGWHDTNALPGPEFTITRGNNAHAYLDQDDNNAMDFAGSPEGGAGLDFDFAADLTEHAQNYRAAAVTNLFYWNNVVHDIAALYGFNEAADNFQQTNYTPTASPFPGDYVRAEAADGGGTNNANFSTPARGGTPRMQMYLWPGGQFGLPNAVTVNGVGTYAAQFARFTPAPTNAGTPVSAFVYGGNGCTAAGYGSVPAGNWIAVADNVAGCNSLQRTQLAESLGARAIVITGTTSILAASMTAAPPAIPAVAVSTADGNAIKAAIAAGPKTGSVHKSATHPGIRDGDLENGIIVHEYGHGISNRLTGGPGKTANCLSGNEQGGEGWSDYLALTLTMNPAVDDPDLGRGMGPYALFQPNRQGAGIRPRPYTRDMAIQPFTYDSIKSGGWLNGTSLAIPHGLGHGWAAVLWDLNWDLVDKHGFEPDLYSGWDGGGNTRALQYVMDGMKFQGCAPTLLRASRAIIAAADTLTGGGDTCTVWATFARRGFGYSAVDGTTGRDDNSEAFDTHPDCLEGFSGRAAEPALNVVRPGATAPMKFATGGDGSLDILADGSPYSRMVDCATLRTVDPNSPYITPRPIPVPAQTPGNSRLSYDSATGQYNFPWKTEQAWGGTCREFVLTRMDGTQHRAFFRFEAAASQPVSGRVRDDAGNPVANAAVTLTGGVVPLSAVSDAAGYYAFESVPKGTYTASASGGGCTGTETKQVTVQGPTTVDFTLPAKSDAFGYTCRLESMAFEEAANVLTLAGDDVSTVVTLPFAFTFYGTAFTQLRVCTNGFVEPVGPATASCSFANTTIPGAARPDGAVFAYWDDLLIDTPVATVRTETKGSAPNRSFTVEWRNARYFGDATRRVDVSLTLYENGQIVTQVRNIADDGRERGNSATLGIENPAETIALEYSFNQPVLGIEPAVNTIRYRPPA